MRGDHTDEKGGPWTHGQLPDVEDYPFQTLDIPYEADYLAGVEWHGPWFWLTQARMVAEVWKLFAPDGGKCRTAGEFKWPGQTPLGTSVSDLVRKDSTGALASPDGWGQDGDAWHPGDTMDPGPIAEDVHVGYGQQQRPRGGIR